MLKFLAIVAVLSAAAVPGTAAQVPAPEGSYAARQSCDHTHRSKVAYRLTTRILKNHSPLTTAEKLKVGHLRACQTTRAKSRAVGRHVRRLRQWRMSYAHRWPIRLNRMDPGWVQWARNITACESGWNQYASNGSHFSYFQWASSTWGAASAGFDAPTSPYDASWPHQAVIAIHWAWSAGTSQWVCKG